MTTTMNRLPVATWNPLGVNYAPASAALPTVPALSLIHISHERFHWLVGEGQSLGVGSGVSGDGDIRAERLAVVRSDRDRIDPGLQAVSYTHLSFQTPEEIPGITLESFLRTAAGAVTGKSVKVMKFRREMAAQMEALNMDPRCV